MNDELKFDRARFDAGEMPTRTRDGRKVLAVHDSGLVTGYPLAAWIADDHYDGECVELHGYTRDGKFFSGEDEPNGRDLVHEPKMRIIKVALLTYPDSFSGSLRSVCSDYRLYERDVTNARKEGRLVAEFEKEVPA